jgi:predicted peroxiredoxin
MDLAVEVYFAAQSVRLLVPGVAAELRATHLHPKTILDAMRKAAAMGASFLACSDALQAAGIDAERLIPECTGRGGAVQFMARAADLRWRALVF